MLLVSEHERVRGVGRCCCHGDTELGEGGAWALVVGVGVVEVEEGEEVCGEECECEK